jgi:chromosome partitioning protein
VLVPVQAEFYALEGLSSLMETVERVRESLNPRLRIEGAVLTMFDGRTRLSGQVADEVRKFFGEKVYHTVIPRNVQLSEAPSHGKPVILYDIRSTGAQAYLNLTKEMVTRG